MTLISNIGENDKILWALEQLPETMAATIYTYVSFPFVKIRLNPLRSVNFICLKQSIPVQFFCVEIAPSHMAQVHTYVLCLRRSLRQNFVRHQNWWKYVRKWRYLLRHWFVCVTWYLWIFLVIKIVMTVVTNGFEKLYSIILWKLQFYNL